MVIISKNRHSTEAYDDHEPEEVEMVVSQAAPEPSNNQNENETDESPINFLTKIKKIGARSKKNIQNRFKNALERKNELEITEDPEVIKIRNKKFTNNFLLARILDQSIFNLFLIWANDKSDTDKCQLKLYHDENQQAIINDIKTKPYCITFQSLGGILAWLSLLIILYWNVCCCGCCRNCFRKGKIRKWVNFVIYNFLVSYGLLIFVLKIKEFIYENKGVTIGEAITSQPKQVDLMTIEELKWINSHYFKMLIVLQTSMIVGNLIILGVHKLCAKCSIEKLEESKIKLICQILVWLTVLASIFGIVDLYQDLIKNSEQRNNFNKILILVIISVIFSLSLNFLITIQSINHIITDKKNKYKEDQFIEAVVDIYVHFSQTSFGGKIMCYFDCCWRYPIMVFSLVATFGYVIYYVVWVGLGPFAMIGRTVAELIN